jgi:hypothetical protein
MTAPAPAASHTLTPPCRLAPVPPPQPTTADLKDIPPIHAQFFYASPIPIDDPLSAATLVGSSSAADAKSSPSSSSSASSKLPLRPFSAGDNAALERAWLGLASDRDRRNHAHARRDRSPSPALSRENAEKLAALVAVLAAKHREKHDREGQGAVVGPVAAPEHGDGGVPVCCAELVLDASAELRREFCAVTRRRQQVLDQDRVLEGVMAQLARLRVEAEGARPASEVGLALALGTSPAVQLAGSLQTRSPTPPVDGMPLSSSLPVGGYIPARPPGLDDGISGKPFVRVEPSPRSNRSSGVATPDDRAAKAGLRGRARGDSRASARGRPAAERLEDSVEVPVGISRLHMVSLPVLQMKPIYWSPVNDIATVLRATWFYRYDTIPVVFGNSD